MQNKYPLWKNILLIVIAISGFIYALPNLYGEDPAVQISVTEPTNLTILRQEVERLLNQVNFKYKSINTLNDYIEVRYASTDLQLLAYDLLKNNFGTKYTIALNLLPKTPTWLAKIGAAPMKQGLDLRGGVHFLLAVDVDSVINRRYEGLIKSIS